MKVVIFGASGGTGRELLKQALERDHQIIAFVRNPDKIADIKTSDMGIIVGDVLDPQAVENAVSEQDAVISAIGAGANRSTLREEGTRNIIECMERKEVRRLVSLSSMGVGDSRSNLGFFTKYIIVPIFLRHAFADHEKQETVIRLSSLDWTIVRPPHLIDGACMGEYKHGIQIGEREIQGKISRADVADFMLNQLTEDTYLRQEVGISY